MKMVFRPRKSRHFSRYLMGYVFLGCGLLLGTQNLLAGACLLLPAAVILYYAPRWELRIEVNEGSIRFSENVVETHPVVVPLADLAEVSRVEEREERKGFLKSYSEFFPFVEFRTRAGRTYRMHDIFDADFDAEIERLAERDGIGLAGFRLPPEG
jgi:hypothetical protein